MSFSNGLMKSANTGGGRLAAVGKHLLEVGKSGLKGLHESGDQTLGSILKMKGLSHLRDAAKEHGGVLKALKTDAGVKSLAKGLGKAAPSLAAGGLYGAGAYKAYKALAGNQDPYYPQGYYY